MCQFVVDLHFRSVLLNSICIRYIHVAFKITLVMPPSYNLLQVLDMHSHFFCKECMYMYVWVYKNIKTLRVLLTVRQMLKTFWQWQPMFLTHKTNFLLKQRDNGIQKIVIVFPQYPLEQGLSLKNLIVILLTSYILKSA